MTIVAALRGLDRKAIFLGSDSQINDRGLRADPVKKWHQIGRYWIGGAGSHRLLYLLRRYANDIDRVIPKTPDGMAEALRNLVESDAWNETKDAEGGMPKRYYLEFILIDGATIYTGDSDFTITEIAGDFIAIGSGKELAIGAHHALQNREADGGMIVEASIVAAVTHRSDCGRPLFFKRIEL